MPAGTILWFNAAKGYGFVRPGDGSGDVFLPAEAARWEDLPRLVEGRAVTFETAIRRGHLTATTITLA